MLSIVKSGFVSLALSCACLSGVSSASETDGDVKWIPTDGEVIEFDVLRKGKPFGRHNLAFSYDDEGRLIVENEIDLEVKVGFVTFFKYTHESTEIWADGVLHSLQAKTRKEGDDLAVTANRSGDVLNVSGTNFSGEAPLGLMPTSHWNVLQMDQTVLLSSEAGKLLDVTIEDLGMDTIKTQSGELVASRYRLTADLAVDLWYDETGRWVKCAFSARGQDIEYVLLDS